MVNASGQLEDIINRAFPKAVYKPLAIQIIYALSVHRLTTNGLDVQFGLTAENLMKKHASKPFNPNIAYVFYLAGFIESWGRGIEKICDACSENGCPLPEFTVNPGDIMVKFTASEDQIVRRPGKVTERVTERVTEQELKVIELLQEDPGYTYAELAEKLSVSRKTISERMKKLREKKVIERVGSATKGYWKMLN